MKYPPILLFITTATSLLAAPPVVSNVTASQRVGTKLVDAYYSVSGSAPFTVWMEVSTDNGATFTIPATSVTGDRGVGISAGSAKHIVWDAGNDWDGNYTAQCRVKIFATDSSVIAAPAGMAYITAGAALGGSPVSAFYMDKFEVSKGMYLNVVTWGLTHGWSNLAVGDGAAPDHPIVSVSWYDCVKWCNARSEKEGLIPCYYTEAAQTNVYRTGDLDIQNTWVKWTANGYRLPTEAEWHRAAAGNATTTYPWGNTITGADCNYTASGDPFSTASIQTTPIGYYNGTTYTITGGTFATNDRRNSYGLYDVCGNALEWCWDWSGGSYPTGTTNSQGPTVGTSRVLLGGAWFNDTSLATLAGHSNGTPSYAGAGSGIRCVRGL